MLNGLLFGVMGFVLIILSQTSPIALQIFCIYAARGSQVRDARDFNNIQTRAVIKFFFFLQGKAPKEIHAIVTETLACFLPGRAKDLSAPLYSLYFTYIAVSNAALNYVERVYCDCNI